MTGKQQIIVPSTYEQKTNSKFGVVFKGQVR